MFKLCKELHQFRDCTVGLELNWENYSPLTNILQGEDFLPQWGNVQRDCGDTLEFATFPMRLAQVPQFWTHLMTTFDVIHRVGGWRPDLCTHKVDRDHETKDWDCGATHIWVNQEQFRFPLLDTWLSLGTLDGALSPAYFAKWRVEMDHTLDQFDSYFCFANKEVECMKSLETPFNLRTMAGDDFLIEVRYFRPTNDWEEIQDFFYATFTGRLRRPLVHTNYLSVLKFAKKCHLPFDLI